MDPKTCHDCTHAEAGKKCPGDNPNRYTSFGPICEHFNEDATSIRADRDRLAARLEVSDDPEMSGDKIDHLEFLLESERKHSKRIAAGLATATDALREQIEARAVTEAEGGALNQLNNIIDRLQAELARVRRNHLRRMEEAIWPHLDSIPSPPGSLPHKEFMIRRRRQWDKMDHRLHQLRHRIRAALAQPQDGTTEGRG